MVCKMRAHIMLRKLHAWTIKFRLLPQKPPLPGRWLNVGANKKSVDVECHEQADFGLVADCDEHQLGLKDTQQKPPVQKDLVERASMMI